MVLAKFEPMNSMSLLLYQLSHTGWQQAWPNVNMIDIICLLLAKTCFGKDRFEKHKSPTRALSIGNAFLNLWVKIYGHPSNSQTVLVCFEGVKIGYCIYCTCYLWRLTIFQVSFIQPPSEYSYKNNLKRTSSPSKI